MRTGSSPCLRLKHASRPGGENTTRVALTGRSRIRHQRSLPSSPQRIRSANLLLPLDTFPRSGTEIAGRPSG